MQSVFMNRADYLPMKASYLEFTGRVAYGCMLCLNIQTNNNCTSATVFTIWVALILKDRLAEQGNSHTKFQSTGSTNTKLKRS